jgi:hypothetical protein
MTDTLTRLAVATLQEAYDAGEAAALADLRQTLSLPADADVAAIHAAVEALVLAGRKAEPDRSGWPVLVKRWDGGFAWPKGHAQGQNLAVWPGSDGEWYSSPNADVGTEYGTKEAAADAIKARLPGEGAPMVTPPKVGDRWGDLSPEQRAMVPVGSEVTIADSGFRTTKDDRGWYGDAPRSPWLDGYCDSILHPNHIITRIGPAPKPPPTTDPPKLLIGMVYETARGASMAFGADWPTPPGTFAIYDSIADYRAGRALWRR